MELSVCPHCNGSLDVKPCDRCSELYPSDELQEVSWGAIFCASCKEDFKDHLDDEF